MSKEIRRVALLVVAMFAALLCASTYITGIEAGSLRSDPRNARAIEKAYAIQRGAILVGGSPVAQSTPSHDRFDYQRTYTDGPLYAPVTGYFTLGQGSSGIESALNAQLSGQSTTGFFAQLNDALTNTKPQGQTVSTTINSAVQKAAYDALGNNTGAVVAIQPSTGKILALVSKGSYDPNALAVHDYAKVTSAYDALVRDPSQPLIDRAIAGNLYFPGSVFKLVVASAAFASGRFSPSSTLPNPLTLQLPQSSTVIHNAGGENCGGTAAVTIALAFQDSCNVPFAELGAAVGYSRIDAMARAYGFDSVFTIPQASEASVFPATKGDEATLMLQSFGQGSVRVTPLQIALITATIANGGREETPSLIDAILNPDLSASKSFTPQTRAQPITAAIASEITTMMKSVVSQGTGTKAQIPGVAVAGKTGTAQNGPGQPYTLWFTGFAPAKNPQVAVAVVVGNGAGQGQSLFGDDVAGPIAKQVIQAALAAGA